MKRALLWLLPLALGSVCHAEDITISYQGAKAKVKQTTKDSVTVNINGANVSIESLYEDHKLTLLLTGHSDDGQLELKTAGKAKIKLDGLTLTSQEGAPICLKNKKKVEVVAAKGTENTLTITACNDTANHKAATLWAKGKLEFSGKGTLNIIATGDGCRGIKTKKDITIEELTLNVTTSGDNLGEKPFGFGGFPGFGGDMPDFGGGMPDFGGERPGFGAPPFQGFPNDSSRRGGFGMPGSGGGFPAFGGMRPEGNDSSRRGGFGMPRPGGGFPAFGGMRPEGNDSSRRGGFGMPRPGGGFSAFGGMRPEGNDSSMRGGFPLFGGGFPSFGDMRPEDNDSTDEGGFGGFAGKHKYVASTKGIASKGKIIINSGNVTVRTSTAGAEGIEGKEGAVFNGGNVDVFSPDDAINANATIEFNGANVLARSSGNDAVDSNPAGGFFPPFGGNNDQDMAPAIIIRGGKVYAWSQVGSPEEGLDCDFAPLVVEGGTIFSVGGGMGEMPSVPSNEDAKQPTALLLRLNIAKDEPINIYDGNGKLIDTVTVPFALRRSASLVTSPAFKIGGSYTVKTKGYEKTFTLNEPFTTISNR